MIKTLLEKMFLKPDYSLAILHVPHDLRSDLHSKQASEKLIGTYNFILAFYTKKQVLEEEIAHIKEALEKNGLLWIAYPKGKALQTDLNRDILHDALKAWGLEAVSLVSLSDTWSVMRFKK